MARKKVDIKYIADGAKRKASFQKRRSGLIKKVREICTLCDVEACIVIFSSNKSEEPVVWPSRSDVESARTKFLEMPDEEQSKKMVNQETYLTQQVEKSQDKVEKLRSENRKKEMNNLMIQCLVDDHSILNTATMVDLNDLTWVINHNLMKINNRLSNLEAHQEEASNSNLNGMDVYNGDEVQHSFGDFNNNTNNNNNNNLQNDDYYVPAVPVFSP